MSVFTPVGLVAPFVRGEVGAVGGLFVLSTINEAVTVRLSVERSVLLAVITLSLHFWKRYPPLGTAVTCVPYELKQTDCVVVPVIVPPVPAEYDNVYFLG